MAGGGIGRRLRLWHGRFRLRAALLRILGPGALLRRATGRLLPSGKGTDALYDRWVARYGGLSASALARLTVALATPGAPAVAVWPDLPSPDDLAGASLLGGAEVQWLDDPASALAAARRSKAAGGDLLLIHVATPGRIAGGAAGRLAMAAAQAPDALLFYGDGDELSGERRMHPAFRPDADPEWSVAADPLGPLLGIRAGLLLAAAERFDLAALDPADRHHALVLTAVELGSAAVMGHVPHILFHQTGPFPPAGGLAERGLRWQAMAGAYLDRLGQQAEVLPHPHDPLALRLVHPLPDPVPRVSVLVPTRDCLDLLRACIDGLLTRTDYTNLEVLILDNGSREPETLNWFRQIMKEDDRVRVLRWDHPFNFAAINNYGASEAHGELLLFLNNDVEVIGPGWLSEMVGQMLRPGVGAVGARLLYGNGTLQHGGVITGVLGAAGHAHKGAAADAPGDLGRLWHVRRVGAVTGACLLTSASLFREVGGFDEDGLAVAYNDVDLCLKLRAAGHAVLWTPYASLYHHESISRGSDQGADTIHRFVNELRTLHDRWGQVLTEDPFFNPNLSLLSEDHLPAFPPRVTD